MTVHQVGTCEEFTQKGRKIVELDGRSIGIYRVKDDYYALLNFCPHQGAPLCKGPVCGTTLPSDVYEFVYGKDEQIVRCPWHGWEFDITTGKSLFNEKIRTRSYRAWSESGAVYVDTGRSEAK